MGVLDRLLERFGYYSKARIEREISGVFPLAYADGERWNIPDPSVYGNQADLYRRISWIASAVQIRAQACALVPFSVLSVSGEDENDIANHPFELLFHHPNPMMSRVELLEAWFSYYILTGNGYLWLNSESEESPPDELWVVPSNQILPIPDGRLYLSHYEYRPGNGEIIELPTWQIVHLKRFNPNNLFIGLSPIEAVAMQAQGDYGRVERDARLYNEKNGRMPGILAFADNFQDNEWETMKKDIGDSANQMRQYMLMRNVKQGGVQWLANAMSNRDMEYLENRRFTMEEIYQLFAPGLASMLAVNATEANSKSGKATFAEYSIWPTLTAGAEKITNDILPLYGDNLKGEFDDVRTKDRTLELQEMQEYAKTHTLAEVRKKYYQDKPLGDERDNLLPAQISAAVGSGEPPQEHPEQLRNAEPPAQEQISADNAQDAENDMESEPVDDESAAEMKRWKRVARKAIKAGKPIPVFVTDVIDAEEQGRIRAGLEGCKTLDDVELVFAPREAVKTDLLAEYMRQTNELLAKLEPARAA